MYRQIEALIDPLTPKIQTFDLRILDSLEKGIQKNSQGHPPAIKSLQTTKKKQQPYPIRATRANPFPKVTGLFCRIPLPTLFTLSRVSETWGPDAVIGAPCHGLSADWMKKKEQNPLFSSAIGRTRFQGPSSALRMLQKSQHSSF